MGVIVSMGKFWDVLRILFLLWVISYIAANVLPSSSIAIPQNAIALIPISGVISVEQNSGIGFTGSASSKIVESIQQADKDARVKAIILEINSPGGTIVASEEIAAAVKATRKPVVAWIREIGTSGAYWVASASDTIVASPMSFTGSIGVIGSYLEFSELMGEYGVRYEALVTGKYKDIGSRYKPLSAGDRDVLMEKLNTAHDYFVEEVARNRGMDKEEVAELATGLFYLGSEAKELGLVDYLGGRKEAIEITKKAAGLDKVSIVKYKEKKGVIDIIKEFSSESGYYIGRGIGSMLGANSLDVYRQIELGA